MPVDKEEYVILSPKLQSNKKIRKTIKMYKKMEDVVER